MADLIAALGLALVIEGGAYTLFPATMKRLMMQVVGQPSGNLRSAGLVAVALGLLVVWVVRG